MINRATMIAGIMLNALCYSTVTAITPDTVEVGNVGSFGHPRIVVPYKYQIGTYEVTNGEYAAFLNAVARRDPHGLYNTEMTTTGITRSGINGSFTYDTIEGREQHPVVYVSFWDAARFVNWLSNGKPTGMQDALSTEDGSYFLNGVTIPEDISVSREADSRWVIPTENEWLKAAHHKNDGDTDNYWEYATMSDRRPTAGAPPGSDSHRIGSVNFDRAVGDTTPVGAYQDFPSAYGTYDQAGNVFEWTESIVFPQPISSNTWTRRRSKGGGWTRELIFLESYVSTASLSSFERNDFGFRVAYVPEPETVSLLLAAICPWIGLRRR